MHGASGLSAPQEVPAPEAPKLCQRTPLAHCVSMFTHDVKVARPSAPVIARHTVSTRLTKRTERAGDAESQSQPFQDGSSPVACKRSHES